MTAATMNCRNSGPPSWKNQPKRKAKAAHAARSTATTSARKRYRLRIVRDRWNYARNARFKADCQEDQRHVRDGKSGQRTQRSGRDQHGERGQPEQVDGPHGQRNGEVRRPEGGMLIG